MYQLEQTDTENIIGWLDEQGFLFPDFELHKENGKPLLLGRGGFSKVYSMRHKTYRDAFFALKVIGFEKHVVPLENFRSTTRCHIALEQESEYILRILNVRELQLILDDAGHVQEVEEASAEQWDDDKLHLQFILMEREEAVVKRDRFGHVYLTNPGLSYGKAAGQSEEAPNAGEADGKMAGGMPDAEAQSSERAASLGASGWKNDRQALEAEVMRLAMQIGQALALAHSYHILHRDIKLENIFWDKKTGTYKLGDFGLAKMMEGKGAETVVYTDGYGAPEIERRLGSSYDETADIYSFGITLYLLLNELRFPGSQGYYAKTEIQYTPDYVFPAPLHASEAMTRIIRKMTAFHPRERYQAVTEVLRDIAAAADMGGVSQAQEYLELADELTETYRETTPLEKTRETGQPYFLSRAYRIENREMLRSVYRKETARFFLIFLTLFFLLFCAMEPDVAEMDFRVLWILPAAVLLEAVFQKMQEINLIFGTLILIFSMLSIVSSGLTIIHLMLMLSVLAGSPLISASSAVAAGLWMYLEAAGGVGFLDFLSKHDLGWIFLAVIICVFQRFLRYRNELEKMSWRAAKVQVFLMEILAPVMLLAGIVLLLLQHFQVMEIPESVRRLHLVRTGLLLFPGWLSQLIWTVSA